MNAPSARVVLEEIDAALLRYVGNSDRKWRLAVAGHILAKICAVGVSVIDPDTGLDLGA